MSTADSNLTFYDFRRFQPSFLPNPRFFEAEIAGIDCGFYSANLSLDVKPSTVDRLGLERCKEDSALKESITRVNILRLRD